jgi:hypothetical protein
MTDTPPNTLPGWHDRSRPARTATRRAHPYPLQAHRPQAMLPTPLTAPRPASPIQNPSPDLCPVGDSVLWPCRPPRHFLPALPHRTASSRPRGGSEDSLVLLSSRRRFHTIRPMFRTPTRLDSATPAASPLAGRARSSHSGYFHPPDGPLRPLASSHLASGSGPARRPVPKLLPIPCTIPDLSSRDPCHRAPYSDLAMRPSNRPVTALASCRDSRLPGQSAGAHLGPVPVAAGPRKPPGPPCSR